MSKTIRVSDEVWERICALQAPRETLSQVIDRCLSTVEAIRTLPIGRPPVVSGHQELLDPNDAYRNARQERADRENIRIKEEL